jgi:hypothetical protein
MYLRSTHRFFLERPSVSLSNALRPLTYHELPPRVFRPVWIGDDGRATRRTSQPYRRRAPEAGPTRSGQSG